MGYCNKCGKKIKEDDDYCGSCGAKIIRDIDKEIEGLKVKTNEIEQENKGNAKEIMGYIFILIFLVIIIFVVLTRNTGIAEGYTLKLKTWLKMML